jgi:hypothetical protein
MKISKEEITNILKQVMPAVEKKGLVEELSHLVFDGAYVLTYNDKIAVSYPVYSEQFDLNCGVVANDFEEAVKSVKTKEVELEVTNNGLIIQGGKTTTTLPFFDQKKIVELHASLNIAEVEKKLLPTPQGLIEGLRVCKFSASDNVDSIKGMYAVRISDGVVFSTNGYQATRYITTESGFPVVYVAKTFIDAIVNFEPVSMLATKTWLFFGNKDQGILACRTSNVGHVFPQNVDHVFPEFDEGFTFEENLSDELSTLEFFSSGESKTDKTIIVAIEDNGKCSLMSSSEKGNVVISTTVKDFKGERVEFHINPGALKEAISLGGIMRVDENSLAIKTEVFDHISALKIA